MLVFSEQHLMPTDVNMITIEASDESGYFYVSRMVYDQAVILHDMYGDNPHNLIKAITGGYETRGDVVTFLRDIPRPINILGPYLMLVSKRIDDLIDMVGAISVLSGMINFRGMLKTPFAMRPSNPSFSLAIANEYKMSWKSFEIISLSYDEVIARMQNPTAAAPVAVAASAPVQTYETPVKEDTEDEGTGDELADAMNGAKTMEDALGALMDMDESYWEDAFDDIEAELTAEAEEEAANPAPVEEPVAAPVAVAEPVASAAVAVPPGSTLVDNLIADLG